MSRTLFASASSEVRARHFSRYAAKMEARPVRTCRLGCGGELVKVLELAPTPPANEFLEDREASLMQAEYPLELMLCQGCGHLQLGHELARERLFDSYLYTSGASGGLVRHFARYAAEMVKDFDLGAEDLVIDVGSNDGTLLKEFRALKVGPLLGVEPAANLVEAAEIAGIPTMHGYWSLRMAEEIVSGYGQARVVTANNVFAHVHDLVQFTQAVRAVLAPDGVFSFEVAYALDMREQGLFDSIYHEHLDYHSVSPLRKFFQRQGLELFNVERQPTHGGSIRGLVGHLGHHPAMTASFERMEAELRDEAKWGVFEKRIRGRVSRVREALVGAHRLCAYGAPAKATTMLYALDGEVASSLGFVVDDSPLKQGRHMPGLGIPIRPSSALYEEPLDACVILAWNLADEIAVRHQAYSDKGGRFVVP